MSSRTLLAATVVCMLAASCSSDSDDAGSGGASSTGGTGGTTSSDAGDAGDLCGDFCTATACCDCSATECATPYNACRCEPDCIDLIDCLRACAPSDTACQDACLASHQAGYEPYVALESCANFYCVSECQSSGDAG